MENSEPQSDDLTAHQCLRQGSLSSRNSFDILLDKLQLRLIEPVD